MRAPGSALPLRRSRHSTGRLIIADVIFVKERLEEAASEAPERDGGCDGCSAF